MASFKRIVVEAPATHRVAVYVDSHDYDREDDVTLEDPATHIPVTYTQAHMRSFREIIDRAHDARVFLNLPDNATIVDVQFIPDEGQRSINSIDPATWVFVWEYFGYSIRKF